MDELFTPIIIGKSLETIEDLNNSSLRGHLHFIGLETSYPEVTANTDNFSLNSTAILGASIGAEIGHSDVPSDASFDNQPSQSKFFRTIGKNGSVPSNLLKSIGGKHVLRYDAADAWIKMREHAKADGVVLTVISSYRTLEDQERVAYQYRNEPGRAATVGKSPHGWAIAVDIQLPGGNTSPGAWKTPQYKWIMENGRKYSWHNPERLRQFSGAKRPKAWHFEYYG